MKALKAVLTVIACAVLLLAVLSCILSSKISVESEVPAPTVAPSPSPTPLPTPEPTPTPPPALQEVAGAFYEILHSTPDGYGFLDAYGAIGLPETPTFQGVLERAEALQELCTAWSASIQESCEDAVRQLEDRFPDITFASECAVVPLDWKHAGALLWMLPEDATGWDVFEATCSLRKQQSGKYLLTFTVAPRELQALLYELADGDRDKYMSARFIQCYLTTVYDDAGEETPYVMPELDPAYVEAMQKPLEKASFWDSWYQGRSRNTRKHTGLDLRARAKTPITSCTDGTVLCVGFRAVPGNYVVILDDLGYEYHYYHMVKESGFLEAGQRVSAGELIGYVGNTGNSAVNHLHLAVVTPDGRYIKLYDIMKEKYKK